jgi:hypothetical protein
MHAWVILLTENTHCILFLVHVCCYINFYCILIYLCA